MHSWYSHCVLVFSFAWLALGPASEIAAASAGAAQAPESSAKKLAPFVPSPMPVVEAMLALAGVTDQDMVYDLGSGDGRIVIAAAKKYGARGVGLEIDPALVRQAWENARQEGVEQLVEFRRQDVTTADVSDATVVTLYLFPEVNLLLKPKLQEQLRPGARVVSSQFGLGDWKPAASFNIQLEGQDGIWRQYTLYLWRIE